MSKVPVQLFPPRLRFRLSGGRPLQQAAAFAGWLVAIAALADFGLYRLPLRGWEVAAAQIGAYAVAVAPIAVWAPRTFATLALPGWQALLGTVLVAAGVSFEAMSRHAGAAAIACNGLRFLATGIGEEIAFRGFLWERTRSAGIALGWVVAVNVLGFTVWHLVSVAAGQAPLSGLIGVAGLGLLFSLVRLWSGNTGLPALLHAAIDASGI